MDGDSEAPVSRYPDAGPYGRAVAEALRAAGIDVTGYEVDDIIPALIVHLGRRQSKQAGYRQQLHLNWTFVNGWAFGPSDPTERGVLLWIEPLGATLLPAPAELAELVQRHVLHTIPADDREYRGVDDDDGFAEQLTRVVSG